MKTKDLREKSVAELEDLLRDTSQELVDLRIRKETGQLEKPHMLKTLRKSIATIQTLLSEMQQQSLKDQYGDPAKDKSLTALASEQGLSHRQVLRNLAKAS